MSYNQFSGVVGNQGGWGSQNNNGGQTSWGNNSQPSNTSWGNNAPASNDNNGIDPWKANNGGGWGGASATIQCSITSPRPDDIKNLPTLEELALQVLRNKDAFKQALESYNAGGFTNVQDAFVKVIGNTFATGLFSLIKPENIYSYAASLANGGEVKVGDLLPTVNVYATLSDADKETYHIIEKFIEYVYKRSGNKKIDLRVNKSKTKSIFVQAFAKFLISDSGKKVIKDTPVERYALDKVWEVYNKI